MTTRRLWTGLMVARFPLVRQGSRLLRDTSKSVGFTCCAILIVVVLSLATLSGCSEKNGRLPPQEAARCAEELLKGHPGALSVNGDSISYSYTSPNGPAKVIVSFDAWRRPVRTFFESAPYGSHEELTEAAVIIKRCAENGRSGHQVSDGDAS
jgi:hypothetical protein